ncbi:hypothetical protein QWA68_012055 [Fusarium oxysporum]|nr:hypothetical protein QWA68_012055 [Fusarium oxysporum]
MGASSRHRVVGINQFTKRKEGRKDEISHRINGVPVIPIPRNCPCYPLCNLKHGCIVGGTILMSLSHLLVSNCICISFTKFPSPLH